MVIWHALASAITLTKRLPQTAFVAERELPIFLPSGKRATSVVEEERVAYPRTKVWSLAMMLCGMATLACYLTWQKGRPDAGRVAESSTNTPQASTEPADRANLHAGQVHLRVALPDEKAVEQWKKYADKGPGADVIWLAYFAKQPRPQAWIEMRNIGRNRVLAPFMVHAAIIIQEELLPGGEDVLFQQRPEWQTGGEFSFGNDWYPYPNDPPHVIHTSYDPSLSKLKDWDDLIHGRKIFYVVTRARYKDKDGILPESESCHWFSFVPPTDRNGTCFGHNN